MSDSSVNLANRDHYSTQRKGGPGDRKGSSSRFTSFRLHHIPVLDRPRAARGARSATNCNANAMDTSSDNTGSKHAEHAGADQHLHGPPPLDCRFLPPDDGACGIVAGNRSLKGDVGTADTSAWFEASFWSKSRLRPKRRIAATADHAAR